MEVRLKIKPCLILFSSIALPLAACNIPTTPSSPTPTATQSPPTGTPDPTAVARPVAGTYACKGRADGQFQSIALLRINQDGTFTEQAAPGFEFETGQGSWTYSPETRRIDFSKDNPQTHAEYTVETGTLLVHLRSDVQRPHTEGERMTCMPR